MKAQAIVFVRHAHRDTSHRSSDNGIDSKGRDQTLALVDLFKSGKLPHSELFWTSPKARCIETIQPLAEAARSKAKIEKLLDEQRPDESSSAFLQRVEQGVKKASSERQTVYLCSHGDWIPEAINILTGQHVELAKGKAIICRYKEGHWKLGELE